MRIKLFLGLLLLTPIMVFLIQNSEPVSIRFLTWIYTLPRVTLLLTVLLFGFISGYLMASLRQRKKRKKQALKDNPPQEKSQQQVPESTAPEEEQDLAPESGDEQPTTQEGTTTDQSGSTV